MVKKLFGYSMSTWLGTLIVFILLPISSHLYPQESLGIINYYYSVVNILFTFLLLALDQAYLRFYSELEDEHRRKSIFSINLVFTALVIVICAALALPLRKDISLWIMGSDNPLIICALCIHLLGLLVTRYFMILYRLRTSFWKYTVISLVNTLLLKAIYIVGAFFGATAEAGIYATAAAALLAAALVLAADRKNLVLRQKRTSLRYLGQELRYALPIIPTMVISVLNNNIPTISLRQSTGFTSVAEYSIGVSLASIITLLHNGLNTFLEPFIFSNHQTKRQQIAFILELYTKLAVFACVGIVLVQDLFFLIFDPQYAPVTAYLPILFASSLWFTIGDFYNVGVKIHKKTIVNVPVYIVGILVNILLCVLLVPKFGNTGAAVAAAAASFAVSTAKVYLGNRCYPLMSSCRTYLVGSAFLVVTFIANRLLAGTVLRHGVILALLLLCGLVLGLFRDALDGLRWYKNSRQANE